MADINIPDQIASEIMDTIEREKRINRDDLRMAVERVLQRTDRWQPPVMIKRGSVTRFNCAPGSIVSAFEVANRFGAIGGSAENALTAYECFVEAQRKSCV